MLLRIVALYLSDSLTMGITIYIYIYTVIFKLKIHRSVSCPTFHPNLHLPATDKGKTYYINSTLTIENLIVRNSIVYYNNNNNQKLFRSLLLFDSRVNFESAVTD